MSDLPETKAMPYDIGSEERGRLVAGGWQIWCDLARKGNPRATLWVRWPKPPKPSLAEAMEDLRRSFVRLGDDVREKAALDMLTIVPLCARMRIGRRREEQHE